MRSTTLPAAEPAPPLDTATLLRQAVADKERAIEASRQHITAIEAWMRALVDGADEQPHLAEVARAMIVAEFWCSVAFAAREELAIAEAVGAAADAD